MSKSSLMQLQKWSLLGWHNKVKQNRYYNSSSLTQLVVLTESKICQQDATHQNDTSFISKRHRFGQWNEHWGQTINVCKEKQGTKYESLSCVTITMPHFQYVLPFEPGEIISTLLFSLIKVGFNLLPKFHFEWYANLFFITVCHDSHRKFTN